MDDIVEQSKAPYYRKKADECLNNAERVSDTNNKARWLQLAEAWQKLADQTEAAAVPAQTLNILGGVESSTATPDKPVSRDLM